MCFMPATATASADSATTPTSRANSDRAKSFGSDILRLCVEVGGVLTGEHGVGVEKRDLMPTMFSEIDLAAAAAGQMRFRRRGPAQSRQGVSGAAPLRRTGPDAYFRRQAAVPGYSEVLDMRFALFCSPKADAPGFAPETGQGFRDYIDYNIEAEALGFHSTFVGRASFHRLDQVSATLEPADLARRAHHHLAARHRGHGAALAQSGAAGRAGGDPRPSIRRPARFRHRQGLPLQRVRGFSHARRRRPTPASRNAIEVLTRPGPRKSPFRIAGGTGISRTSSSSRRRRSSRTRRSGWAPAASARSNAVAARGFNLILDQYASPASIGERIALFKDELVAQGLVFNPLQVTVARQLYIAKDEADKQAALVRQAAYTKRTVDVARTPDGKPGSHVLAYADKAGATEENALYGTPDEIAAMLETLRDRRRCLCPAHHRRRQGAIARLCARHHAGVICISAGSRGRRRRMTRTADDRMW